MATSTSKEEKIIQAIEKMLDEMIREAVDGGWQQYCNLRHDIMAKVRKLANSNKRPKKKKPTANSPI